MAINNIKNKDYVPDRLSSLKDIHNKVINDDNDNNDTRSLKAGWWINELDSLGIKKSYDKNESNYLQNLEDLSDNKKQDFIREYKICYHNVLLH
jgi:hypothetical protein